MPRPEDTIRRYLDANQGTVTVSVRQALSSWGLERPTREDRARIARDLAAAGIECDPPLVEGELESRVTLRVREQPQAVGPRAGATAAGPREGPPAAGPPPGSAGSSRGRDLAGRLGQAGSGLAQGARRAGAGAAALDPPAGHRALIGALVAGGVGCLIALGPDSIYGYGLALGVLALALLLAARSGGSRPAPAKGWAARLPWMAGGLGALALVLGVLGSLTIETIDSSTQAGAGTADARERDAFCASSAGDELARLGLRTTRSPEELREVTDEVLDVARDAPPGTNCAVLALNAIAGEWIVFGDFPEYDDAEEQVERIRDLQEDRGLREPAA